MLFDPTMDFENAGRASSMSNRFIERYPDSGKDSNLFQALTAQLKDIAQRLAHDAPQRVAFVATGALDDTLNSTVHLYEAYEKRETDRKALSVEEVEIQSRNLDGSPPQGRGEMIQLLTLHMRVLRNAVAACPDAQDRLCLRFDRLQPLLLFVTSFHTMTDTEMAILTRSVAQMLSNLITANSSVQAQLWTRLVVTTSKTDQISLKLLSSPDTPTQSAAQVLLINFLKSPQDALQALQRCRELCTTPAGLEVIEVLLQSAESIVLQTTTHSDDLEQVVMPQEVQYLEESLGLIYSLFVHIFEQGHALHVLQGLAPVEVISSVSLLEDRQVTNSSQLVLLKLLDSWLHQCQKQLRQGGSQLTTPSISTKFNQFGGLDGLIDLYMSLSRFARGAMSKGIAKDGEDEAEIQQDKRLIGIHQALLLVLQCLLSITMSADGWSCKLDSDSMPTGAERIGIGRITRCVLTSLRLNHSFVNELVDLLNQTHLYAPALSPFRAKEPGNGPAVPLPAGHALSSTGQADSKPQPVYGFDHLKRDIVRVIGSIVYFPLSNSIRTSDTTDESAASRQDDLDLTRSQIKSVQDRVRDKGGLFHVLNMTVLDERNPYMREHAIFALRYLLANNETSQDLIASLQPTTANHLDHQRGGVAVPMY